MLLLAGVVLKEKEQGLGQPWKVRWCDRNGSLAVVHKKYTQFLISNFTMTSKSDSCGDAPDGGVVEERSPTKPTGAPPLLSLDLGCPPAFLNSATRPDLPRYIYLILFFKKQPVCKFTSRSVENISHCFPLPPASPTRTDR